MENLLFDFISKYVALTEDEKKAIIDLDIFRSVKKGTILLKEGEQTNEGFFVLKGCIRKYYLIDGDEKTTAFYTEMEGLTPHCVADNSSSKYYIASVEDCILTVANPEMEILVSSLNLNLCVESCPSIY